VLPDFLLERYADAQSLGVGGMGQVWRARDTQLGRDVAIKLIHPSDDDDSYRARFEGEAMALSRIDHPNVLRLFDYGERDGIQYLVTEFLEGRSFAELPAMVDPRPGWFQVGEGLQAAHLAGLIHRDVKLENALLVDHRGGVLIDFGLALVPDVERWTRTGAVVGSTAFMAPELIREGLYSRPSDWYAWGAGLFFLLEGRPPYPLLEVIHAAHLELQFHNLRPGDPAREVLQDLLALDPAQRPPSWEDIHGRLASSAGAAQERWRAPARAFERPGASQAEAPAPTRRGATLAALLGVATVAGFLLAPEPSVRPPSVPQAPTTAADADASPASLDALDQALQRWEFGEGTSDQAGFQERKSRLARRLAEARGSLLWERYRQALSRVVADLGDLTVQDQAPPDWLSRVADDLVPRVLELEEMMRHTAWAMETAGGRTRYRHGQTSGLSLEEVALAKQRLEEIRSAREFLPLPSPDGTGAVELRLVLAGVTWLRSGRERHRLLADHLVRAARGLPRGLPRDGLIGLMSMCLGSIRRNLDTCPDSARLVSAIKTRLPDLEGLPLPRRGRALHLALAPLATIGPECKIQVPIQPFEVQALVAPLMEAARAEPWLAQAARSELRGYAMWRALTTGVPEWHEELSESLLTDEDRARRARWRERRRRERSGPSSPETTSEDLPEP
jgi:serine/threonine-protein kinase